MKNNKSTSFIVPSADSGDQVTAGVR